MHIQIWNLFNVWEHQIKACKEDGAWLTLTGGVVTTGGGTTAGFSSFCLSTFLGGGSGGWGTTLTTQLNILDEQRHRDGEKLNVRFFVIILFYR